MNVLSGISAGYIKMQKRHTILTEVGIILSVVLMTVILISVTTVIKTARNITEYTDGTYDVIFNELDKDNAITISNMDIFDRKCVYSISSYTETVSYDLGEYSSARYLADTSGNLISDTFYRFGSEGLDMLPSEMTKLVSGRLPEKDGEITLSEVDAQMFGNLNVGDTVTFVRYDVENKADMNADECDVNSDEYIIPDTLITHYHVTNAEKITFDVVGISANTSIVSYNDNTLKSFVTEKDKLLLKFNDEQYDYYWNLHYAFQDAGLEIDDFDYAMNQQYLNFAGRGVTAKSFNTVLYMLIYLIVFFIMFCVRMVIDNSFEISSHERIRQYGVIRAVGAAKKQVLAILVYEALFLSSVGVPVGIILGTGISHVLYSVISGNDALSALVSGADFNEMAEYYAPWWVFVSSAFIGVFWVLISAVGTGMRVNRLSPVEAMGAAAKSKRIKLGRPERNAKEGRAGVEWLIAFRSIRRNNKRFLITLFSMAISVVMYAGFSYAAEVWENKYEDDYSESNKAFDYEVSIMDTEHENTSAEAQEMIDSGYFENVQYDSYLVFVTKSDENTTGNEKITGSYYLYVHPINENTYKRLTGKDDFSEFEKSGGVIIDNTVYDGDETRELYTKLPDTISSSVFVDYTSYEYINFTLYGSYETDIDLYSSNTYAGNIIGLMAESNYEEIVTAIGADTASVYMGDINGERGYLYPRTIYADAKDNNYSSAKSWLERHYIDFYTDNYSDAKSAKATLEFVKICGYFLIALFTLIAAVNIINIISTNVLNRTSEIGMLRACGMSSGQIYKMVSSESIIYAGIASISACLVIWGVIAIIWAPFYFEWGYFRQSDLTVSLSFIAPIKYMLIGALGAFIIGAAAVIPAARRIIKTPIIDAVEKTD